jgi:hypothetical protein
MLDETRRHEGKITGNMTTWNEQGMTHLRDIFNGPENFQHVASNGITFLEKRLADGRGARLNLDYTFKGFID